MTTKETESVLVNTLPNSNLKITEIYKSIQGESSFAGLPCIFVRTTGCPLRCTWCDTDYAFYNGNLMSQDEIVRAIESLSCNLVEFTGGEPLIHKEKLLPLWNYLHKNGYTILLETSGAIDISDVPHFIIKIMDIKCPGSAEEEKNLLSNLQFLALTDELKLVILNRADYDWAKQFLVDHQLMDFKNILFSPVHGELSASLLSEWIMQDNLPVRLNLQQHKYIWGQFTKGV